MQAQNKNIMCNLFLKNTGRNEKYEKDLDKC